MSNEKVFLFLLIFCWALLAFNVPTIPVRSQDFVFHYVASAGLPLDELRVEELSTFRNEPNYPPFVHVISVPFAGSEFSFSLFWLIVLLLAIPCILTILFNNYYILLTYLCVPFFYSTWYSFTIAQAVVSFLAVLLVFFLVKKYYTLVPFAVLLLYYVHNSGVLLGLVVVSSFCIYWLLGKFSKDFFPLVVLYNAKPLLSNPLTAFFKFFPVPLLLLIRKVNVFLFVSFVLYILSFSFNSRIAETASLFLCVGVAISLKEKFVYNLLFVCIVLLCFFLQLLL